MKKVLLMLAMATAAMTASAHQFRVLNKGKLIYYNVVSEGNLTIEVTYSGNAYNAVPNEYADNIEIPEKVSQLGKDYTVVGIGKDAFRGCIRLRSVKMPKTVSNIDESAFEGCQGLVTVQLPEGVEEIKKETFAGCENLSYIKIPSTVEKIDESAFKNCSMMVNLILPASLNVFNTNAVDGCKSMTSIEVDTLNAVYSSRNGVLFDKNGTTILRCPEGKASYIIGDGVSVIGERAFRGCSKLNAIEIPYNVKQMMNGAFEECTLLKEIKIPESLTFVADGAFKNCTTLRDVTLSEQTKMVREESFSGCTALENLNIPEVTEIGTRAFYNCTALKTLVLPKTLKLLRKEAFGGCANLMDIKAEAAVPAQCEGSVFDPRSTYKCALTVPEGKVAAYRGAVGWKGIYSIK